MARPKDDIAGVAVDLAAGQDHLLKLVEQQKQREQQRPRGAADNKEPAPKSSSLPSGTTDTTPPEESARARRQRKRSDQNASTGANTRETWVTPSFKAKESRCREVDQVFYTMRATGQGFRTKQELVDEALAWLVQKYGSQATKRSG